MGHIGMDKWELKHLTDITLENVTARIAPKRPQYEENISLWFDKLMKHYSQIWAEAIAEVIDYNNERITEEIGEMLNEMRPDPLGDEHDSDK